MVGRARLQTVAQAADGDVQGALSVQILKEDGTAFDGTLYNAQTGGSVVTSPRNTNSQTGLLEVWTDANSAKRVILRATGATDLKASFDYDPQDVFVQSMNRAAVLDGWTGVSTDVLTIQPTTAGSSSGDNILRLKNSAGTTAFRVGALGSGGGSNALIGTWVNTDVGPLVISSVENWNSNADLFFGTVKLTGNPTGSHQGSVWTYQSCAQPSDGFNGVSNIPDHCVANFDYFAQNVASGASQNHDGSGRAIEIQTLVYENTGQRTMAAMTVGTHTAVSKTSYTDRWLATGANTGFTTENGDCGIIIRNDDQTLTGFGTDVMGNTALLIAGALGWKQSIAVRNTSDQTIFAVDKDGIAWATGFYPMPGSSVTLGTAARTLTAAYISTLAAANGAANSPSIAVLGPSSNYASGLFGSASSDIVGVTVNTTEAARFDANGAAFAGNMRLNGVISPSQLTGNTDDWAPTGLASARIIRIAANGSYNLTGIAAPSGPVRQVVTLVSVTSNVITLKHETTSTATNRFNFGNGADVVLNIHSSITLWYDTTATRWKTMDSL